MVERVPAPTVSTLTPVGVTARGECAGAHVEEEVVGVILTDDEVRVPIIGAVTVEVVDLGAGWEWPPATGGGHYHVMHPDVPVAVSAGMAGAMDGGIGLHRRLS